ncbi:MAG: polyketide beta-ketoacyl:ACP synthase (plasmid) [Candidatus Entotheonella factor]|uniref:Polyketide beta-ketoacyl:ACP synthase n=1 Tax=Entotheonella factor TaxID=1429438 RepID=W4M279_ENTF1|nr:MAG: polyketide beta-ketoacyl:ACP synthase [Candidatus Entotheonella factor]
MRGGHAFRVMQRQGRQRGDSTFLGAEIAELAIPGDLSKNLLRAASLSGKLALMTLAEAWEEAHLEAVDPRRIGLVVGGSNFQQRELQQTQETYADRLHFLRPNYALNFLDSDLCGLCSEQFGIRGFAYTLGGASASGQVALIQAAEAVLADRVDICIAMGAMMDLSYWECAGFRALGAMGSDRHGQQPALACRPFDANRDGFIYGESCGVVVVEKAHSAQRRNLNPYAVLAGWAMGMDGNRSSNPSLEGEIHVIQAALSQAGLQPLDIDYVNPHGTGSIIGDETELEAIDTCGLGHALINATKSITGHGLSSAGIVELIATLLQMREARLHPTRNLEKPIDPSFNWVREQAIDHKIVSALKLSMGFGGINTAVCINKP